jgi:hypothetical protein
LFSNTWDRITTSRPWHISGIQSNVLSELERKPTQVWCCRECDGTGKTSMLGEGVYLKVDGSSVPTDVKPYDVLLDS